MASADAAGATLLTKPAKAKSSHAIQSNLGLEVNIKGGFDQVEPTIYYGQDLDYPTFLRRGVRIGDQTERPVVVGKS